MEILVEPLVMNNSGHGYIRELSITFVRLIRAFMNNDTSIPSQSHNEHEWCSTKGPNHRFIDEAH